ncbi:hypothetical protein SAMN05444722_1404 [Rhodovulum sp. ES.010]|uniref:helix-turn-helix domain-containing protein n=1 Tax=Rhodovulum sp. ES.010 TaxID=1882821 RepID=UPI00092B1954|nr:helix-turn-helix transcriptional regulator [Rhodovulum sp. ES.010]SIO31827.1 hypothetical protein SAMN05444722_1404 [Rhodovulum sp. ES.010]
MAQTQRAALAEAPRNGGASAALRPEAGEDGPLPAEPVDIEARIAEDLEALSPRERWAVLSDSAKELSRIEAARLMREMLSRRPNSVNELAEAFGFAPATVSDIVRGKSKEGPKLWVLIAMAELLGLELDISVRPR